MNSSYRVCDRRCAMQKSIVVRSPLGLSYRVLWAF